MSADREHWFPYERDAVPAESTNEFSSFLSYSASSTSEFRPTDETCSTWENAPNLPTYASFGDGGVTASVNAHGHLLQFGRYLGVGTSGLFSVDHSSTDEAYYNVYRLESLRDLYRSTPGAGDRMMTYGLTFEERILSDEPRLTYVHNRWPRYQHVTEMFDVSIQWAIYNQTVLQQIVVKNLSKDDRMIRFSFACDLLIRDMDLLDYHDDLPPHQIFGPNGYGKLFVSPIAPGQEEDKPREENDKADSSMKPGVKGVPSPAVVVVVSVFVNGRTMQNVGVGNAWEFTFCDSSTSVEIVTAYKMLLLPQGRTDWKALLVPVDHANMKVALDKSRFAPVNSPGLNIFAQKHDNGLSENLSSKASQQAMAGKDQNNSGPRNPDGIPDDEPSHHIDFLVRRNLEHILSVCAIPVTSPVLDNEACASQPNGGIVPVALTCGDMSTYRISTPASFFAFQFLVEIASRLGEEDPLRKRIYWVCRGHLHWLWLAWSSHSKYQTPEEAMSQEKEPEPQGFVANYWVTGKRMPSSSATFIPTDSLTDTAFQLIKAAEFWRLWREDKGDRAIVDSILKDVGTVWARNLAVLDRREKFVWPHAEHEGVDRFRLDDHVLIWRALQSMKDLGALDTQQPDSGKNSDRKFENLVKTVSQGGFQRTILEHFTTENDVSGKRMLAVTRSVRETRFMLHARDTVLFYGIDWGLRLDKSSSAEVWDNTIEAQLHHDGNQEVTWDNAIRYALAIMMGCRGKKINRRPSNELVKLSFEVLLGSTTLNAFFPGQLNKNTKEPDVFDREEYRDFYFHASFEIPFVLLRHAGDIVAAYDKLREEHEKPKPAAGQQSLPDGATTVDVTDHDIAEASQRIMAQRKYQPAGGDHDSGHVPGATKMHTVSTKTHDVDLSAFQIPRSARKISAMQKFIPYSSLIDSNYIVELHEEWLYRYPTFFLRHRSLTVEDVEREVSNLAPAWLTVPAVDSKTAVVVRAAAFYKENAKARVISCLFPKDKECFNSNRCSVSIWIVDAPKRKQKGKRAAERDEARAEPTEATTNMALWKILREPRTPEKAKKRLHWLHKSDDETAFICYLNGHDVVEMNSLFEFFEHHERQDNYFFDDTTMVYNTWETELHISFYQLVDTSLSTDHTRICRSHDEAFPGSTTKVITRASIGFRFFGDFFDRYWTCHVIEKIPAVSSRKFMEDDFESETKYTEQRVWWQRKYLELLLLDRILTEAVRSTQGIYEEVRKKLGIDDRALDSGTLTSIFNSDDYFAFKTQWMKLHQVLQAVEDELVPVFETLLKWEMREKDRGQEQPRWTRKDESRYRGSIRKLTVSTSRRVRDLRVYRNKIISLKLKLATSQDKIRADLGLMGAENIRFFTYVTVIFLPLGFAVSIFSTSGTPGNGVLVPMVVCAVVSLAATIVALINAKGLNAIHATVSRWVHDYSTEKMQETALAKQLNQWNETIEDVTTVSHESRTTSFSAQSSRFPKTAPPVAGNSANRYRSRPLPSAGNDVNSWHVWFWVAYVLIELPARRILRACNAIQEDKFSTKAVWCLFISLILAPMFLIMWLLQILIYNIFDGSVLLWGCVVQFCATSGSNKDALFEERLQKLTYPMKPYRPLRKPL